AGPAGRNRPRRAAGLGRREAARRLMAKAKLWGGRFKASLLPELERFSSSLEQDLELFEYDIAGSIAHARGLHAAGLLSRSQLQAIERGLKRVHRELRSGAFEFAETDEDVHTAVERRLTELAPDAGARLHAGRSRNDQVATDIRLYCRAACSALAQRLAAWTLPLRREVLLKELGFSEISENSIDAVSDRDFALDLVHACALIGLHLSRFGEDLVLWASSEFGFLKLADEVSTGSSLMPQK